MGQRNAIIDWMGIARGSQIRRNVVRNAVSPSLRSEIFRKSLFHQSMILGPVFSLVCDGDRDDSGGGVAMLRQGRFWDRGGDGTVLQAGRVAGGSGERTF